MLRKVKLYGELAKVVGHRVLEAEVASAAQAIRFLVANWPELHKYMADKYYKIVCDNWELTEEELHYPTGSSDIKIIPIVGGAGNNTTRIIVGVVLLGIAIAAPGAVVMSGKFAATGKGFWAGAAAFGGNVGAYLVLSGVAGALTPVPSTPEQEQDPRTSFSFSGIQNTSRAGVAVPVIYGETITGSVVISAAIDTVQVEV